MDQIGVIFWYSSLGFVKVFLRARKYLEREPERISKRHVWDVAVFYKVIKGRVWFMSFSLAIFQSKTTVVKKPCKMSNEFFNFFFVISHDFWIQNLWQQIWKMRQNETFLSTMITAFHSVLPIALHFFQVGDTIVIILIDLRQMSGALYQQ